MAPRVRFLQKVQKQLPVNESADETNPVKETEQNKNTISSINKEGVEKCRTNFSGKVSANKAKEEERRKETEHPPSSEGVEESDESEDESEESEEEEKEAALSSRAPNTDSMQFFEDDDDDDDDTKDFDLLTVKRRNVFGMEAKDGPAQVSTFHSKAYES